MRISFLLLFCGLSFMHAQTTVANGLINEPTVWHAFLSPYIVSLDLEIGPHGVLQLEPGVEIRFENGSGILVQGRLESLGTDVQPVRMGPLRTDQGANWKGIQMFGKKASLHLQYTDVLLAEVGLAIKGSGLKPVVIEDCTFGYGKIGLLIEEEPLDFAASRNAFVQNEVGIEFLTGGIFKSFVGNEICANKQYQAAMRTKEAVSLANNCWCELDLRATGRNNGILDRRTQADLGYLDISSTNNCNILNTTAEYIKGGGDVTVVLDDYVSTQNESPWEMAMLIYPQPMMSKATIDLSETWRGPLQLQIYDLQGRLVYSQGYPESRQIELNRTMMPSAGMYLLRLSDKEGHFASSTLILR